MASMVSTTETRLPLQDNTLFSFVSHNYSASSISSIESVSSSHEDLCGTDPGCDSHANDTTKDKEEEGSLETHQTVVSSGDTPPLRTLPAPLPVDFDVHCPSAGPEPKTAPPTCLSVPPRLSEFEIHPEEDQPKTLERSYSTGCIVDPPAWDISQHQDTPSLSFATPQLPPTFSLSQSSTSKAWRPQRKIKPAVMPEAKPFAVTVWNSRPFKEHKELRDYLNKRDTSRAPKVIRGGRLHDYRERAQTLLAFSSPDFPDHWNAFVEAAGGRQSEEYDDEGFAELLKVVTTDGDCELKCFIDELINHFDQYKRGQEASEDGHTPLRKRKSNSFDQSAKPPSDSS